MSARGTTEILSSLPPQGDDDPPVDDPNLEQAPPDDEPPPPQDPLASLTPVEREAYGQGWRPREEWRGSPNQWRTAEEFVRRGRDIASIANQKADRAQAENTRLAAELADIKAREERRDREFAALRDQNRTAEQAGYDRAIRELKDKRRAAAADNNMAEYTNLTEQIEAVEEERAVARAATPPTPSNAADPPPPPPNPVPQAQPLRPEVQAFIDENPWYTADQVLNEAMVGEHRLLRAQAPAMDLTENLRVAKERVMARFPDKFGLPPQNEAPPNARQRQPGPAAPTPPARQPARGARGLMQIPDEGERAIARQAFDSMKRAMPDLNEDDYIQLYNDPKADVLEIVRLRKAAEKRRA